jgi:UDP-N-acetylmuramate--alanine ligase
MRPAGVHRVYFIGIGGIGMSALAKYYLERNIPVAGFDRNRSRITDELEAAGAAISTELSTDAIPANHKQKSGTLVIFTPAIAPENPIRTFFADGQFDMRKRAEVLADIANAGFCIAVAGTHGKTTTSSMIAHILSHAGRKPIAFLGGIASNFGSNYIGGKGPEIVVEADEFDRSFLHLKPSIGIITATDPDHLDIYGDAEQFQKAFVEFGRRCQESGKVFVRLGTGIAGPSYGLDKTANNFGSNIRVEKGQYVFDLHLEGQLIEKIPCGLPGIHNVENAVAAAIVAKACGLNAEQIKSGIATFKGVWRRFDVRFKGIEQVYIDDYAHHPEELRALIQSVRTLYPDMPVRLVFQPHLFSRTRDFAADFAAALGLADELLLMEIYPARELPIEGITSQWLLEQVPLSKKGLFSKEEILEQFSKNSRGVIVTAGAGDIDALVAPLESLMVNQLNTTQP